MPRMQELVIGIVVTGMAAIFALMAVAGHYEG